jgi:uncharacterized protein YwqG
MLDISSFLAKNTRNFSAIHIDELPPSGNPLASHFGLSPVRNPNESWPVFINSSSQESENLFFICQLNLTEAPYVPDLLSDIKLINIFVRNDDEEVFSIRAYKDLDGLIPMEVPEGATFEKGFEIKYELAADQPIHDDSDLIEPMEDIEFDSKEFEERDYMIDKLDHQYCSKIGGYASIIQEDPFPSIAVYESDSIHPAKPKFCLQIDSEEKIGLMWGHSGVLYIGRGTAKGCEDQWFIEYQCY